MLIRCPRQAVIALNKASWTEARIAAACGTSQSTVHRIKSGKQKTVSFDLGSALILLAEQQGISRADTTPGCEGQAG